VRRLRVTGIRGRAAERPREVMRVGVRRVRSSSTPHLLRAAGLAVPRGSRGSRP